MYNIITEPFEHLVHTMRDPDRAGCYLISEEQKEYLQELVKKADSEIHAGVIRLRTLGEIASHATETTNPPEQLLTIQLGLLVKDLAESVEAFQYMRNDARHIVKNGRVIGTGGIEMNEESTINGDTEVEFNRSKLVELMTQVQRGISTTNKPEFNRLLGKIIATSDDPKTNEKAVAELTEVLKRLYNPVLATHVQSEQVGVSS